MWCGVGVACLVFGRRLALVGYAIHTVCVPRLLGLDITASVCNKMYLILNKPCLLCMMCCRIYAETKTIAYCSYACRVFSGDSERRKRGGGRAHSRERKSSRNKQKAGGKDPSANVRNFYHPHNFVLAHPHTTSGPPQFNALSNSTGGNTVGGVCGVRLSCFSFS